MDFHASTDNESSVWSAGAVEGSSYMPEYPGGALAASAWIDRNPKRQMRLYYVFEGQVCEAINDGINNGGQWVKGKVFED